MITTILVVCLVASLVWALGMAILSEQAARRLIKSQKGLIEALELEIAAQKKLIDAQALLISVTQPDRAVQ